MAVNSNHPPKSSPTPLCLERKLNLFDSAMIMMGIVIGSGIFLTTGIMATSIPSPGLILLAWLVGGLLTLAGALTYAELGAALPEAGGQYVYLREAFGPLVAFLFGWVLFLVYMTGGIAALALAFSEYLSYFFPFFSSENLVFSLKISESIHYGLSTGQLLGVILIIFLTIVNIWGLILGKSLQNFLTVIKIVMIGGLIIFGLSLGQGEWFSLQLSPSGHTFWELLSGFGVALIAVTWAFDGWN
ncbi:MAG TPA: amino acid permease, partial [Candidatus Aminicenantes bacterium]|nr:amino acid permease [Candidatus Aminicenantes bacterium]